MIDAQGILIVPVMRCLSLSLITRREIRSWNVQIPPLSSRVSDHHQQHNLIHFNSPKLTSNTKAPPTATMRFPTPLLALLTLLTLALGAPSSLKPRATDGWTIQDFTRDCRDENICIYGFTLDIYGFAQEHCTIIDVVELGPATTHSWYNVPCEEVRQSPSLGFSASPIQPRPIPSQHPSSSVRVALKAHKVPRLPHLLGMELRRRLHGHDRRPRADARGGVLRV